MRNDTKRYTDEERKTLLSSGVGYLMFGDLDKPFHRSECDCKQCEEWRTAHNRPTHGEVREYLNARAESSER